jgi:NitT/TauT family transport system substrate-binding protein
MKISTITAVLAAALSFSTGASASNVKVNIGYATAADFLPAFVSKENGCLAANGIDAQLTRIPVTNNIPPALVADTLQIGAGTATMFLATVENGLDLVAVAGGTKILKGNETISLVTSPSLQVKSPGDVVGKKIGAPGINSVADVMFRKWLRNGGVEPSKVTIVETPFPQMKDLIKSKTIDGALAVEPIRSSIVNDGIGQRASVEFHTSVVEKSILAFWMASKKWAEKNPQAVASFNKCLTESIAWIGANREQAKDIEKKYLGFNTPVRPDWDVDIKGEDFGVYIDVSLEFNVIRKRVNPNSLVWKRS